MPAPADGEVVGLHGRIWRATGPVEVHPWIRTREHEGAEIDAAAGVIEILREKTGTEPDDAPTRTVRSSVDVTAPSKALRRIVYAPGTEKVASVDSALGALKSRMQARWPGSTSL